MTISIADKFGRALIKLHRLIQCRMECNVKQKFGYSNDSTVMPNNNNKQLKCEEVTFRIIILFSYKFKATP